MNSEQVRCEFENKILTVFLSGEIDHHSASDVREEIDRNIFFYRPKKVVFDLSEIGFMDSSGLGLILGRYTKVKDLGGEMAIENPSEEILKILRLAGADKLFGLDARNKKRCAGYKFTKSQGEKCEKSERREIKK
jgi:stage II sporulation protein AA (anti-sigma F factor antagonist)